jgi:class 3 adenylate cyclase
VARLRPERRSSLPTSAFADPERRRLPINDEAHVRNALARFNQVRFDDDAARSRARSRLLKAAKRYGIVPVGFLDGQLRSERDLGRDEASRPTPVPSGSVTMLMTDIEGSTALVRRFGEQYEAVLDGVRQLLQEATVASGGTVVEARADEFFAVFVDAASGVEAAVAMQRGLATRTWLDGANVSVRIGMHTGEPTPTAGNYIGLPVHATARISAIGHGGQILVSDDTRSAARAGGLAGIRFFALGAATLRGLPEPVGIHQVAAKGLRVKFPPVVR